MEQAKNEYLKKLATDAEKVLTRLKEIRAKVKNSTMDRVSEAERLIDPPKKKGGSAP